MIYRAKQTTQGYMVLHLNDAPYPIVWVMQGEKFNVLACGVNETTDDLVPIRYNKEGREYVVWVNKDHIEKVEGNEGFASK